MKLEQALACSELPSKTQAALADAIADHEGLDAAPKDLVNKMFRERPVDPKTIERAAQVLGVDAATLYLTESDQPLPTAHGQQETSPGNARPRSRNLVLAVSLAVLLLLVTSAFIIQRSFAGGGEFGCTGSLLSNHASTPANRLGLVIARFAGDPDNEAQMRLARAFSSDPKFKNSLQIFTVCERLNIEGAGDYRQAIRQARSVASDKLKATNAQLLLWGERFGNRLNVRFATNRSGEAPLIIALNGKPVSVTETDFTIPVSLDPEKPITPALKFAALDIAETKTADRMALRERLKSEFRNSSQWLSDAVISDRNLLQTISPQLDPHRYGLLANQLCYRLRLLGDEEGSPRYYSEAEQVCRNALEVTSKQKSPMQWANLQVNLGSVLLRSAASAGDPNDKIELLRRAIGEIQQAGSIADRKSHPEIYIAYNRNLGAAHVRLGEMLPGKGGVNELLLGKSLTLKTLPLLDSQSTPNDYAISTQNLCMINQTLAQRLQDYSLIRQAQENCRNALKAISKLSQPQTWALAQNNLAITYAVGADMQQNVPMMREALHEFKLAQTVYTRDADPAKWAMIEVNSGELLCHIAARTRSRSTLSEARSRTSLALEQFEDRGIESYATYAKNLLRYISECRPEAKGGCSCTPAD